MLGESAESSVVRQNVVDFLYAVTDNSAVVGGVGAGTPAGISSLLGDMEVVEALWAAACSRAPNPRHLHSLVEVRDALETRSNQKLPKPGWWDRIAAEVGLETLGEETPDGGEVAEQ